MARRRKITSCWAKYVRCRPFHSVIQKKRAKMLVEVALQYDNTMVTFMTYCLKKEKTLHISCRLTVAATWIVLIMSAVTKKQLLNN